MDAKVIGVSTDSIATNRQFAVEHDIDFPLISDENRRIKKLYGRGRVTYLIDKSGIIRFIQNGVPNNEDFLNELKRLK